MELILFVLDLLDKFIDW